MTAAVTAVTWPAVVDAVEVLPAGAAERDYDGWCVTRRRGLGGSDVSAVLGRHPWSSPYEVWLDKTGRKPPKRERYVMARGRYFEPAIAQWYSDTTGLHTARTGMWARRDAPWMCCNPDRFTSDGAGAEFKKVGADWTHLWRPGPAPHAADQALWGMAVTGLAAWYVAADVDLGRAELPVWRLDRDEEAIAYRMEFCDWWWHRYVVADRPPPVDGSEATTTALKEAYTSPVLLGHMVILPGLRARVQRWQAIKAQQKILDRERRLIENWIRAGLEHDEVGCDDEGIPLVAWSPRADGVRAFKEIR